MFEVESMFVILPGRSGQPVNGRLRKAKQKKKKFLQRNEEPLLDNNSEREKEDNCQEEECKSLKLLLRHQLRVRSNKMAAAIRKLFRSSDKIDPNSDKRGNGKHNNNNNQRHNKDKSNNNDMHQISVTNQIGINSPSSAARRFFNRHLEGSGSKISPSDPLLVAPMSPSLGSAKNKSITTIKSSPATPSKSSPTRSTFKGNIFKKSSSNSSMTEPNAKHMKLVRTRRLMKEFQELHRGQLQNPNPVFTVDLVNDCLYEWKVRSIDRLKFKILVLNFICFVYLFSE